MATLVLTAAGGLIAGPFGAALGAIAGQRIDSSLFAPKARQGPRLGDLSVQTSSYGTAIPKIFGTMRVAGTVIWATDLKEQKGRSGGGKGRPATESYSYSASFAVALSGRRIRSVRRIWADGKLLRGAAGDFKSQTEYRLYTGTEDQAVDPLIGAAEGNAKTPAHRGTAYAVFEDFQLADYGNRIPSLTFEVEADAEPVTIGAIAEELTTGDLRAGETASLAGYAASGDSIRSAIEALHDLFSLSLIEVEGQPVLTRAGAPAVPVDDSETGARGAGGTGGRTEFARKAAASGGSEVSIAYYDASREYQSGLQRARRGGAAGKSEQLALPAVLTAEETKGLAKARLENVVAGRKTAKLHLACRWAHLRPGRVAQLPSQKGSWRISRWSLDRMIVTLELVCISARGAVAADAAPGRTLSQPDELHGPTSLFLFDLPALGEELAIRPQLAAMAAGTNAGWRRAALLASYDRGKSWIPEGSTAAPAILGYALTAAAPSGAALFDARRHVDVELLNDGMWLESRDDDALASGSNVALLGEELIQFGAAQPIGPRRFRLSRLLRGRRGTEWAASKHVAGEPFALIHPETIALLNLPAGLIGSEARLLAEGIGDPIDPPPVTATVHGRALIPPSPVHLRAERLFSGDIEISWVRRSRLGWSWGAGSDAPLAEETESYELILSGAGSRRAVMLNETRYLYTAEQRAFDGQTGALKIELTQIGTHARSEPAVLSIQ